MLRGGQAGYWAVRTGPLRGGMEAIPSICKPLGMTGRSAGRPRLRSSILARLACKYERPSERWRATRTALSAWVFCDY